MPVDPSISLGIATPQMGGVNLGMVGQFAQIQNAMNQARMFNEQWAAQHQAGEIMATAPNIEDGTNQIMKAGLGPYVGNFLNQIRQMRLTDVQTAKETISAADTALSAAYKATFGAALDPNMTRQEFDSYAAPVINGMPKGDIRNSAIAQWNAYGESLFGGGVTPGQRRQKAIGQAMGHGLTPDDMYKVAGAIPPTFTTPIGREGDPQPMVISGGGLLGAPSYQRVYPGAAGAPGGGALAPGGAAPGAGGALAPTGGGGGLQPSEPLRGPTLGERTFAEKLPDMSMAYQKELDTRVRSGQQVMQRIDQIRELMRKVPTGPETRWREPAADFLASIGVSDDLVNKARGGDFASGQELAKFFMQTAMDQLTQQLPAGSRLNLREYEGALKSNPNMAMRPEAIDGMLNYWTKLHQLDVAEQEQYPGYTSHGGNPMSWGAIWNKHLQDTGAVPVHPNVTGQAKGEEPGAGAAKPPPAAAKKPTAGDIGRDYFK